MHAWVNGRLLEDPTSAGPDRHRPRPHRRRRRLRGGQGGARAPLRADPAPGAAGAVGRGTRAARPHPSTTYDAAWTRCWRPRSCRWAGCGSPTPAGVAPLGSGRGDNPRRWSWSRTSWRRDPATATLVVRCRGRATSGAPWPGSRRRRTPRTSSRWPTPGRGAPARRVFANLAGHLCEGTGSNVFYVRGGRAAHPVAGVRVPGRRQPGPAPGVVRRLARSTSPSRCWPTRRRSSWCRRPATSSRSRGCDGPGARRRAGDPVSARRSWAGTGPRGPRPLRVRARLGRRAPARTRRSALRRPRR